MREHKPEDNPLRVRPCPICRLAMLRDEAGWHCPQCGSAILDGKAAAVSRREPAPASGPAPAVKAARS